MVSSREQVPAAGDDATVISGRPPVGPLSMADIGRALEGRRLGAYQLEQFVGGGGMGAVFRALDTTLDRVVAVKVLSRQQSADDEMLKRFRNEAQSAARLDHENIGRVHAVGSEDGWHFIVFEFIEGTNLRDVVRESGPFDVARTINVTIQVADALEHAAEREVVHRDIKPSNIIITPTGRARLVDMGLARLHHVEAQEDLTTSGMTLGTFDYISPEQARDPRSADVRSDLYSLGCTMFFLLAGRPPFADGTMVQKLLQHQQEPPPAIETLRPDLPRRLAAVIARLMAKEPAARYQRPADLIADLLGVAEDEGIDVSGSRSPTVAAVEPAPAASAAPTWLPWLLPVAALAALVLGLWWRSFSARTTAALKPGIARSQDDVGDEAPAAPVPTTPWRVVDVPEGDRETTSLADALSRAGDGDVVELAYDGLRDEQPIALTRVSVTVRGAPGRDPGVRFLLTATEGGTTGRPPAAWTVESGALTIDQVRVVLVAGERSGATAMFELGAAAALVCEACRLEIQRGDDLFGTAGESVFVRAGGEAPDAVTRNEVRVARTIAIGGGGFLRIADARHVDLIWSGGRCAVAENFLVIEGGVLADGPVPTASLSLADAVFACRGGFARLLDSPARPALPELRVFADACRFAVADGAALLEQTGIEEPNRYRAAAAWLDAGSRYQGSSVFRRIAGAAERLEVDYASAVPPLVFTPEIDADVAAWWSGPPDS